ncbi:N-acetyltransferase [Pseudoclavibacter endophyticus]|nr:N-acetyltransferase [Pseudoclavibacter endophyticus]
MPAAARVLAEAFECYPWTRWAIPADGYSRRLLELQSLYLSYALDEGVVLVDEQLGGVIALLPPTAAPPSEEFQERVAQLHGDRLTVVGEVRLPPSPEGYWTLETLGVRPDRQGAGLGGALVRAGLDIASKSTLHGVALETSDERNVRLYERVGFAVTAVTTIDRGPVVYSMVCEGTEKP